MELPPIDANAADSRQRLIQAAAEMFMKEGYRASIERIASCAGVARQTVYNHFSSKDDLFSEVANIAAGTILISLDGEEEEVRERLLRFALALRRRVLGEEGLAMFRAIAAEAPRFPALGRAFFVKGPEQTLSRLAAFLAQAMEEGKLRRDDPRFAAELLISMLEGFERLRRLFGADPSPEVQEEEQAARIVDSFLRAYRPSLEGSAHG
ncbi:MAG: TetR/AcrR family transcriptional regulator [Magnetococcales bacterium]|nr:TetR/AcrR family transcriptional regulator [Magnetococcales bacterium]